MEDFEKAVTLFSSEGELRQVENAKIGVKRSLPSVGITTNDAVILGTLTKQSRSSLLEQDLVGSAYKIGERVGMVSSGRVADAQGIAEDMRDIAVDEIDKYGRIQDVRMICKEVAKEVREATQRVTERPYGVSVLVGGIDGDGQTSLYRIEVDGKITEWSAVSMGRNEDRSMELLKQNYEDEIGVDGATTLATNSLKEGAEQEMDVEDISLLRITENEMSRVAQSDVAEILGDQNE